MAARPALSPATPNNQLGSQPVMESKVPVVSSVTSVWTRIWSLRLPQWQLPVVPSFFRSQQQGSDSPQVTREVTETSATCNTSHPTSVVSSYSSLDQAQQSMHILADRISRQAKLQGLPWPMMCCTRRSALRWHVEWHGLQWPAKLDSLELQLDRYY